MPGALAGTGGSLRSYAGERYLASSSLLPWPSGGRSITTPPCTPSSPLMRSTASPSTDVSPSTSSPSAVKNSVAAARSSTTMPMCSKCMTFPFGGRSALRHEDLRESAALEALLFDDVQLQVIFEVGEWTAPRADRNRDG